MMLNRPRAQAALPAALIVLMALVLRIGFVLAYEQYPPFRGDDANYDAIAVNLASGRGFVREVGDRARGIVVEPVIAHGPGYPAFLALVYEVFGRSVTAVRLVQALFGAALVAVVVLVARAVFDARTALVAGVLVAVNPALIMYTGMLLTETVFGFLLSLAVGGMIAGARSPASWPWPATGIALGLAVLLREEALAVGALLGATVAWWGARRHKARNLMLLAVALALSVSVWTLRNYLVFHEVVLVSANGGPALWISTVGWSEFRNDDEHYRALVEGRSYLERSHVLRREAVRNILRDPARYVRLCIERIPPFWLGSHTTYLAGFSESFETYYARGARARLAVKSVLLLFNVGILVLAVWGAWFSLSAGGEQRCLRLLCLCPVLAIATVHVFLFSTSRYQVPVLPFILMFGAAGAVAIGSPKPGDTARVSCHA